jgi:hypothetical protein
MKNIYLLIALGAIFLTGCSSSPKHIVENEKADEAFVSKNSPNIVATCILDEWQKAIDELNDDDDYIILFSSFTTKITKSDNGYYVSLNHDSDAHLLADITKTISGSSVNFYYPQSFEVVRVIFRGNWRSSLGVVSKC